MFTRVRNYNLTAPQLAGISMMIVSDIHLEPSPDRHDLAILDTIYKMAERHSPSLIIIGGDVWDSLNGIERTEAREPLEKALSQLAKIAPVYIGIGNHDQCIYSKKDKQLRYKSSLFQLYRQFLQSLNGIALHPITILHNSRVVDTMTDINLIGLTLPARYYGIGRQRDYGIERGEVLDGMIHRWKNLFHQAEKYKYTLALIHSPLLLSPQVLQRMPKVDLFIAGHMHNGCVPLILYGLTWWSDRGLISPEMKWWPRRARNTLRRQSRLLTVGSAKVFSSRRPALDMLGRILFPVEISFVYFT